MQKFCGFYIFASSGHRSDASGCHQDYLPVRGPRSAATGACRSRTWSGFELVGEAGEWYQVAYQHASLGRRVGFLQRDAVVIVKPVAPVIERPAPPVAEPAAAAPAPRQVATSSPCIIVKMYQKKAADAFIRWTVPKPFNYVEGDLPVGIKFRFELNDKHIREIQERGGHVVVLKSEYGLPDLQDARQFCKAWQDGD
jgi:hypothetical protein